MMIVNRSKSSNLVQEWTPPREHVWLSRVAPRTSWTIMRSTKDFVDQHQIKMQSVGDMPTVVACCLHRLDACKGWRIYRGSSIGEAELLPWTPTLRFRFRLCVYDVLHQHHLPRCCPCLSLSHDLHNTVAVCPCIMGSIVAQHSTAPSIRVVSLAQFLSVCRGMTCLGSAHHAAISRTYPWWHVRA
jgi:hypothetical protein